MTSRLHGVTKLAVMTAGLALSGCQASSTAEDRAVFDHLINHPDHRSLGITVTAEAADRVFDCYTKKIRDAGASQPSVTEALKTLLADKEPQYSSKEEKNQTGMRLLLAMASITECQGGLPPPNG